MQSEFQLERVQDDDRPFLAGEGSDQKPRLSALWIRVCIARNNL